jgi:hypothetical protein
LSFQIPYNESAGDWATTCKLITRMIANRILFFMPIFFYKKGLVVGSADFHPTPLIKS